MYVIKSISQVQFISEQFIYFAENLDLGRINGLCRNQLKKEEMKRNESYQLVFNIFKFYEYAY